MPMSPPPPPKGFAFDQIVKSDTKSIDGRDLLLDSIRKGKKLRKTQTVDKSAPVLGKVVGNTSSSNALKTHSTTNFSINSGINDLPLASLFAYGMPKLKPVGNSRNKESMGNNKELDENYRTSVDKVALYQSMPGFKTASSGSSQVKTKSILETNIKPSNTEIKRGPPPQPPFQKSYVPLSVSDSTIDTFSSKSASAGSMSNLSSSLNYNNETLKKNTQNNSSINLSQSNLNIPNKSSLFANKSNLHASLSSLNQNSKFSVADNGVMLNSNSKTVINHGKPNLAPKPPSLNASTKPSVMRAHSMKSPRTPPVTPPGLVPFGTLRCSPAGFHFSQDSIKMKPAPPIPQISRPNIPPPIRPPANRPPPPPNRSASTTITESINNNNSQIQGRPALPCKLSLSQNSGCGGSKPLINLSCGIYNVSMGVPPPPPPHRSLPAPLPPGSSNVSKQAVTNNAAPLPPVRNSSMRNCNGINGSSMSAVILDLETRFSDMFHPIKDFPQPTQFCDLQKTYNSKNQNKQQINSVSKQMSFSKQQAPLPPLQTPTIQLSRKLYSDDSTDC